MPLLQSDTSFAAEFVDSERILTASESLPLLTPHGGQTQIESKRSSRFTGIFLALLATFIYSLATLILKEFQNYHPFTVSIWRFQGMIIPSIPVILYHIYGDKQPVLGTILPLNDKKNRKAIIFIIIRSIVGCTSTVLQIYAVHLLNLADASVIVFSTPVFVTLLAHVFLGERAGLFSVFTAIFTFAGVVIIARPPILTGQSIDPNTSLGTLFALGSMMLTTIVYVILRFLRDVHYSVVTVSYGILGSIECICLALSIDVLEFPQGLREWGLAVALIIFTFGGQTLLIIAFKYEQAGPVALIQSTDVIFSFVLQFVFLAVTPDLYSLTGALIVLSGVALTTLRKWIITLPDDHPTRLQFSFCL